MPDISMLAQGYKTLRGVNEVPDVVLRAKSSIGSWISTKNMLEAVLEDMQREAAKRFRAAKHVGITVVGTVNTMWDDMEGLVQMNVSIFCIASATAKSAVAEYGVDKSVPRGTRMITLE
jgi:hypothetical protein